MTQSLSPFLIDNLDLAMVKSNAGFGLSTGTIVVSTNNYLNAVVANNMTGYDLIIIKREYQHSFTSPLLETNYRLPPALSGTGITTGNVSNRYIGPSGTAPNPNYANISWTFGMQSATPGGTAAVPTQVPGPAIMTPNRDILIIAPGASFGVSLGGPAGTGIGNNTAQSASMEVTLVGFIRPS